MKLTQFLNEEEGKKKEDIHRKIKDFFRKNPNPDDHKVHAFAEKLGMEPDDFEEHIYMLLSDYIKKEKISEQTLNEIFVEEAKDDLEILRLSIIAELDAQNLYERMAKVTRNQKVKETLLDVAYEEKVHAGEFETLLEEIDPDYEDAEEEGEDEVEDMG